MLLYQKEEEEEGDTIEVYTEYITLFSMYLWICYVGYLFSQTAKGRRTFFSSIYFSVVGSSDGLVYSSRKRMGGG